MLSLIQGEEYMGIWTGIVIPILSSIIGGLLGGLFTFLGIKLTLNNEQRLKNEERRLKIIDENLQIVKNRPILDLTTQKTSVDMNCNVFLLPIEKYKLTSPSEIEYEFITDYKNDNVWCEYSIFLKNIGNKKITRAFVTTEVNDILLYGESDIYNWNSFKHFYNHIVLFQGDLKKNSICQINVHYPKTNSRLKDICFNIYFEDENGNFWKQYFIGNQYVDTTLYAGISSSEYSAYLRQDMFTFYAYQKAFFSKCELDFKHNISEMLKMLDDNLKKWNKEYQEFESFKYEYENGIIALKKDFSQF